MKTVHIDLADHGLEGQWVDVRDPRFLSMRRLANWQDAVKDGTLDNERFVRDFVTAWHLLDADTEAVMSDPKTDDIGGLSAIVFTALNEGLRDLFRGPVAEPGDGRPNLRVVDGDPGDAKPAA